MPQKFVLRVLGLSDELLGWAEVSLRPVAGLFCLDQPLRIPMDAAGVVTRLVGHACDLDVRFLLQTPVLDHPVSAGDSINLPAGSAILRIATQDDVPLPPVTVRSVITIAPPMGRAQAHGG